MAKFHYHHDHMLWLVTVYILSKSPSFPSPVIIPQFSYPFFTLESVFHYQREQKYCTDFKFRQEGNPPVGIRVFLGWCVGAHI